METLKGITRQDYVAGLRLEYQLAEMALARAYDEENVFAISNASHDLGLAKGQLIALGEHVRLSADTYTN